MSTFLTRIRPPAGLILLGLLGGCTHRVVGVAMWVVPPSLSDPSDLAGGDRQAPSNPGPAAWPALSDSALGGPGLGSGRVELTAANNETVAFRFQTRIGKRTAELPDLLVSPFVSLDWNRGANAASGFRIDAGIVQLFRMHRVRAPDLPGWSIKTTPPDRRSAEPLDVLVPIRAPRGGLPATMLPGTTMTFWAEVSVPKGTPAGVYESRITLTGRGVELCSVDVQLMVRPFVLPDVVDTPVVVELDHRALFRHHVRDHGLPVRVSADDWRGGDHEAELNALLTATMRMLRRHRLTPVLPKLAPLIKLDAYNRLDVDWGQYDQVVEPYLSGRAFRNRVALGVWPMPLSRFLVPPSDDATGSTRDSGSVLERILVACARHFEQKGWLDRSYALVPEATIPGPETARKTRSFARAAHGADERITVASPLWPQDVSPCGWVDYPWTDLREAVDLWLPPAAFYDPDAMAEQRAAGKRSWLVADRPPFSGSTSIHASPADQRVLSWQAYRLGADALFLGCVNGGSTTIDDPSPDECVRGDFHVLLYPGRVFGLDRPVPSVRLKRLRDSLQDAAYRQLLAEHGLDHVTRALARSLAPYAGTQAYRTHFADGRPNGWPADETTFDLGRNIMAEELMRSIRGKRGSGGNQAFVRTAAWHRLMLATRRLDLSVDGVRLRFRGTPDHWEAEVETSLTVRNGTRGPVAGTLQFAGLPDEAWTASGDAEGIRIDAPNRWRHAVMLATTRELPTGPKGLVALPVELITSEGIELRRVARVACVTAVTTPNGPTIDGDLSDWPLGSVNVVSGFRLITGTTSESADGASGRPDHATVGFVMRRGEDLYVAVNCEFEPTRAGSRSAHNRVTYDDLVPVGGELVELLFDPLNAGSRLPQDLFHIAVKPSGAYVAEHGIRFRLPCGLRSPWLVDVEVATRVRGGRWTAELRIPLRAFGDAERERTFWGFNVTRFDAARREFSNWSGAVGNAYDPLSLGNLYLP